MAFEKQPRYVLTRIRERDGQRLYMSDAGEETFILPVFGAAWSNGEPGRWTLHQAELRHKAANDETGPGLHGHLPECRWRIMPYTPDMSWN